MERKPNPSPSKGIPLFRVIQMLREAQIGAFAAQAAFFVLLSAMPFLVFLTAVMRYVPWSEGDLARLFPSLLGEELQKLLPDSSPSAAVISLSAATALWSASRGIVALTRGLNKMYGLTETRSYVLLRFFALAETLILEITLICTLGGAVRGNLLLSEGEESNLWKELLRTGAGFCLLAVFFVFLYTLLPDHSTGVFPQLPGALGAAAGWIAFTEGYSFYVEKIANFSQLYGALSNVAMLMLWLWLCLCILFLGAFVNRILSEIR